ncbi:MAG: metal-dependent hydrolase [Parcubacteria group bacterium]|nr:metal-dependent hydrolase [Parcubacteria group bacterium]
MFLDIGVGIILSMIFGRWLGVELTGGFVLAGIAFALLPDTDVFVELWQRRGKLGGRTQGFHRTITHYPLLYVPVVVLVWIIWGAVWATFLGAAVLAHFLHDSVGTGWGIKWLWPFSQNRYKFFAGKDGRQSANFIVSWAPEEWREAVERHGDPDWFKHIYLRPSPVFVVELLVFAASVLMLLSYF